MNQILTIEHALTSGRVDAAAYAAQELLTGQDGTAAHELGEVIRKLYRDFHVEAVHNFHDQLLQSLGADAVRPVFDSVRPDFDLTIQWNKRLDDLANERLANEIMDKVKASDLAGAEQSVAGLMASADKPEHRAQRLRQIGSILGGLVHERDRAQQLVKAISKNPQKFGTDFIAVTELEEEFQKSAGQAARRERPIGAMARTELTNATVELSRALPGRMVLKEPSREDNEGFDRTMRAIIRCCLLSHAHNKYNETTLLMVEFSPKELSAAGALAGVEQRLYGTLGRTARLVASKVFADIGSEPRVYDSYAEFAKANLGSKLGRYTVEVLGLLQNPQAFPFLSHVLADKKSNARLETIFALGAIGDDRCQRTLVHVLDSDVRGRVIDGEPRRDAFSVISALGRASRGMDATSRSRLAAHVIKTLPKDDMEFLVRTVLNFFTGKLDGMDPSLLSWAAKVGVASLWNIDRPELARAGRASALGFRQPLVELLGRLAPHVMPVINEAVLAHAKTYSGAYLALGEFYARHGDASALPVLRQLLLNVSLHDDTTQKGQYVKEMILDTTTDEKTEISTDNILASLIYAVDKVGGAEGEAMLAELFEQVQAGQMEKPGQETADILMRAHQRRALEKGQSAFGVFPGAGAQAAPELEAIPALSDEDHEDLKSLEAHYLLAGKRREKKVAAMMGLSRRKTIAGVAPMISHLADTDPIIASAALGALNDFGSGPTPAIILDRFHDDLLTMLESGSNDIKVKLAEVLMKLNPKKSPLKERLEKFALRPNLQMPVKAILAKLMGVTAAKTAPAAAVADPGAEPTASDKFLPGKKGGELTELDKRRAYMLARQEWIKGGKRGAEPLPPK